MNEEVSKIRILGDDEDHYLSDVYVNISNSEDIQQPTGPMNHTIFENAMNQFLNKLFAYLDYNPGDYSKNITITKKPIDLLFPECSRIVIIGSPGSGRSTLIKYLALKTLKQRDVFPIFISWKSIHKDDFKPATNKKIPSEDVFFNKSIRG